MPKKTRAPRLSHLDAEGRARMVDVSEKKRDRPLGARRGRGHARARGLGRAGRRREPQGRRARRRAPRRHPGREADGGVDSALPPARLRLGRRGRRAARGAAGRRPHGRRCAGRGRRATRWRRSSRRPPPPSRSTTCARPRTRGSSSGRSRSSRRRAARAARGAAASASRQLPRERARDEPQAVGPGQAEEVRLHDAACEERLDRVVDRHVHEDGAAGVGDLLRVRDDGADLPRPSRARAPRRRGRARARGGRGRRACSRPCGRAPWPGTARSARARGP